MLSGDTITGGLLEKNKLRKQRFGMFWGNDTVNAIDVTLNRSVFESEWEGGK